MINTRSIYKFNVGLLLVPFLQAELGFTVVGGFNRANVFHENTEMQVWSGDIKAPAFGIERKIGPVIATIGYLNGGYINGYSDIDTTLSISYINTQSYYPLNFGKFVFLAGIYVGAPLSAIKTYSSGGSTKVDIEELNIDYGALIGVSYGISERYGVRLFLNYGIAELWKEPQERKKLTTIIGGACIYYNL
tara:strand:+ start:75 stop:647 length:573 start_codon:yes stop_codon:yes gene_type:complete